MNTHQRPITQAEPLYLVMAGGDAFQSEIVPESKLDDAFLLTQWGSLDDIDPDRRAEALEHFHNDDEWTHTEVTGHGDRLEYSLSFEDGWVQVIRLPQGACGLLAALQFQQAQDARLDDYATEINRLRNVIQAACLGGTDMMIERWIQLFPDAPVPTVKPQPGAGYKFLEDGKTMIPKGWTWCRIEHEPGYPEDMAFGPVVLMERLKRQLDHYYAAKLALAPQAQAVSPWLPIESAPRDGTSILLLIEGGELPLQDDSLSVSIGAYGVHGGPNEDPTWDFAGWSWHQDCYCRGDGKPVGWMPRPDTTVAAPAAQKEPA